MNNLNEILTDIEKEKSTIIEVNKDKPLRRTLNNMIAIKDLNEYDKNKKIVRIIFEDGYVVKLQSHDNGTPYIFVFNEKNKEFKYLKSCIETLCIRENLQLTEINI